MSNLIQFPTPAAPVSIADQVAAYTPEDVQANRDDIYSSITSERFTELMGMTVAEVIEMDYDEQLLIWNQVSMIRSDFEVSREEQIHLDDIGEVVTYHPYF